MSSSTKIINLFGEPSCGKSTTAAGLFFGMKNLGLRVELVTEYAKDCVWEHKKYTLNDQLYISAKQNHKLETLRKQVDYIITDSPLLLGLIYKRETMYPSFTSLIKEVFDSYDNSCYLIHRHKSYKTDGRNQTEDQAKVVASSIKSMLVSLSVPHIEIRGDITAPRVIWKSLLEQNKVPNLPFPIDLKWISNLQ